MTTVCLQVGEFYSERDATNQSSIVYTPKTNIDWPGGYKPLDEPPCRYNGSKCPRDKKKTAIAAGVLGVILLCVILLALSLYRKLRADQEIEGLLWRINPDCLQVRKNR
jgi:hypothetical protein